MRLGLFIGKMKIWQQRIQTYIGIINFLMLFYVFIQDNKWFNWYEWIIIIIIVCSTILYIDIKYVMPNALGYQWDKNKSFKRLERKIDVLMKTNGEEE